VKKCFAFLFVGTSFFFTLSSANAYCYAEAEQAYGVSKTLLQAIAKQESSERPNLIHRNSNGSWDIGVMQINSSWIPRLSKYGIVESDLWNPCINVMIGAWILKSNFSRMGYNLDALGAYNTNDPILRKRYALQVIRRVK
jgi:soluble lytic murein transglycosylase-like protein